MKKLTILVVSFDGVGHVNACVGTARPLVQRGHRVVFLADEAYRGKLSPHGIEECIVPLSTAPTQENAGEAWANTLVELGVLGSHPQEHKYLKTIETFVLGEAADASLKLFDHHTKAAIAQYQPDLFVVDAYLPPCVYYSGKPWVNNMSLTPLMFAFDESDNFPPAGSGIAYDAPRDDAWYRFKELNKKAKYSSKRNDLLESMGYGRYPDDRIFPYHDALLTVYACPEEYNYPDLRTLKGWFNIEVFNKPNVTTQQQVKPIDQLVPADFAHDTMQGRWSGKWIYLSMGSMGSIDIDLMRRLLSALATTNHKVIVSKGPRHSEYSLPANAWGDRFLPQMALMPHMHLVITHGGNNTVTETFAQGKPMIVVPMFGDQFDNAQRLHETGLGCRLDPYHFTAQQLIDSVDRLLYDAQLNKRLSLASQRIISTDHHSQMAQLIEQLWLERQQTN